MKKLLCWGLGLGLGSMGLTGRVMRALLGRGRRVSNPSLNESDDAESRTADQREEEREDEREGEGEENDGTRDGIEKRCVLAIAAASALAADAAATAVKAALHMVRLRSECEQRNRSGGGSGSSTGIIRPLMDSSYTDAWKHRVAAVQIQTAFRGFLARKAYRALRGLVKLQALVRGYLVRKQANATLRAMQALIRVQSCVRAHRLRIFKQGQAVQVSDYSREAEPFAYERRWCDKQNTTGEIQTELRQRQESTVKHERARMDAFSSQVKVRRNKMSVRITPPNPYSGENLNKFSEHISPRCSSIGTPTRLPFSPHNATSCTSSVSNMHKRAAGKPSMLPGYMASTECYKAKCRSSSLGDLNVPKEARRRNASHDLTLHDVSSEYDGYSSISVMPPPYLIPSIRDEVVQAFRRAQP